MPAGALTDAYGNPMDVYSGSFEVDWNADVPYPVPLSAEQPLGSLIYQGSHSALISSGDTDTFTIDLVPNHSLTIVVNPEDNLQPTVELLDPGGMRVGIATPIPGADTILQTAHLTSEGTYKIKVTGGGTTAARRTERALDAGALVHLFASELHEDFDDLKVNPNFTHHQRAPGIEDFVGAVVACG